jgi:hypothetical protein
MGVGVCAAYAASELELFDNEPPTVIMHPICLVLL